ncbi:MAG: SDR family NAD(P)-dependent oxidoreductase, partial [Gammaproteobacteria bacterium]|nr:SDR family NAD(P)-dependent oxidoreductase [Gammaproteobacteria bacterium]
MSYRIPKDFKVAPDCLKDRVIVVTGGANGIGAAASRVYASHGATVVLMDKNVELLESLYDELEDAGYPQPAIYPMDFEGA